MGFTLAVGHAGCRPADARLLGVEPACLPTALGMRPLPICGGLREVAELLLPPARHPRVEQNEHARPQLSSLRAHTRVRSGAGPARRPKVRRRMENSERRLVPWEIASMLASRALLPAFRRGDDSACARPALQRSRQALPCICARLRALGLRLLDALRYRARWRRAAACPAHRVVVV